MVVLQSIKPLGADFMGIGPMLGSPLQGPYSRKAHPEGFTLHKNVCRDPQYEVWTSVGIVSCKKVRYQPGIDLRISYPT